VGVWQYATPSSARQRPAHGKEKSVMADSAASAKRNDSMADKRTRLIALVAERSLLRGTDIKLASGASSTFYFDMKRTTFDPEGAALIADLMFAALDGTDADYVGGLEMGAVPLVACLSQRSFPERPVRGFFVRKKPKDHGTRRLIEGLMEGESLSGKNVILVEDVTTTGGSVMQAVEAVEADGGKVTTIVTVVDRLEGASANLEKHGIALKPILTVDDFRVK
tara:strand:- start:353 stop:1021 length:669 start_codon:yes stop_codon:yes gene_type:complete